MIGRGEGHAEQRAAAWVVFDGNGSAVRLCKALDDAETRPVCLAPETLKYVGQILVSNNATVIAHAVLGPRPALTSVGVLPGAWASAFSMIAIDAVDRFCMAKHSRIANRVEPEVTLRLGHFRGHRSDDLALDIGDTPALFR